MNAGNRQFKNSRWEVERERCRIARPFPPPARKDPDSLAAIMLRLLPTVLRNDESTRDSLLRQWPRLLGERLSECSRPGEYRDGILTIYTRGSAALMRLQRFERRKLVAKLEDQLGPEFKDVRLRLDPDRT